MRKLDPIHTQAVGIGNLRYFRAPIKGPEQPWCSYDDLLKCIGLPRPARKYFSAKTKQDWSETVWTVETDNGPTLIVPHQIAYSFIGAMQDMEKEPPGFAKRYLEGVVAASHVLTSGMSEEDSFQYIMDATRNALGLEGPHPKVKLQRFDGRPE